MLRSWASVTDISPAKPMFLAGYPHVERTSEGIHEPLLATALYLENDCVGAVMVTIDLLFVGIDAARKLRRKIAQTVEVREECTFISCTNFTFRACFLS